MRKEKKSLARQQYENVYRMMRNGHEFGSLADPVTGWSFVKAADYSIQARDDYMFGWKNLNRWTIWQNGKYNRWAEDEFYTR